MFPTLQIGPVSLPAPDFLFLLSFYAGLALMEVDLRRSGKKPDFYSNTLLYGAIIFFLAGRLGYVLVHLTAFSGSPLDIFSLNRDLFDPWVGLVAVLLFFWITLQKQNIPFSVALDDTSIFFAFLVFGFGVSNLASGNAYGIASDLPWAIDLWGLRRHPVQIYQLVLQTIVIAILLYRIAKVRSSQGSFLLMMILISASYLFHSAYTANEPFILGGVRTSQVLWWLIFVIAYVLKVRTQKTPTLIGEPKNG